MHWNSGFCVSWKIREIEGDVTVGSTDEYEGGEKRDFRVVPCGMASTPLTMTRW